MKAIAWALASVWAVALAAVAWVAVLTGILPAWGAVFLAGCLGLGAWVVVVLTAPRGAHADRARLRVADLEPARVGSMSLDAELDYRARNELPPLDRWAQEYEIAEPLVYGMTSGGGEPPWDMTERWPAHDDPHYLPSPAGPGSASSSLTLPGLAVTAAPGPDCQEHPPSWPVTRPASGPPPELPEDTEFRAWMAADALASERALTADAHQFIAMKWDDVTNYLLRLQEAW